MEPVLLKAYKFPTPRVQLQDGKVQLKWQGDEYAQSYRIYRAAASRGPYVLVGQAASGATTYIDNQGFAPQTANTRYYYAISAVDRSSNESIRSNTVSITVPKPPIGQPQSVSATFQVNRSVKVSWSPVPKASGYYVYRQVAPSSGGNGERLPESADRPK